MKTNTGTTGGGKTLTLPKPTKEKEGTDTTTISSGTKKKPKKVVAIKQRDFGDYPELWSRVLVIGPEKNVGFPQMFARAKCSRADSFNEADFVVFSGGSADVDPRLYGEPRYCMTNTRESLMREYLDAFQTCLSEGIPMVGVCLGAQFLHVMNGGKLYQDCSNHYQDHPIWLVNEERSITVSSSVHHQLAYPNDEMIVIATADESTRRIMPHGVIESRSMNSRAHEEDIEAFMYPETGCFCYQGHPEYANYPEYTRWFLEELISNIIENPDYEVSSGRARMRKDIIDQRSYELPETVVNYLKENT